MSPRPSQHRRFGAAVLAAVWLVVPLLALLHGSHAHRFCAAHGTFEEAAHATGDGLELAAVDATGPRVTDAAPEGSVGGHEACPLLGAWPRQGLKGTGPAWLDVVAAVTASRVVGQPLVPLQVASLAVAPKGSPPRA